MSNEQVERQTDRQRSTRDVFEDHLRNRQQNRLEDDIAHNYASDVVLLTGVGIYHGHEGVRRSARELHHYLPDAEYEYHTQLVEGEWAFLEWTAHNARELVCDGADSFVIRNGRIRAQMIHYTVRNGPDQAN